MNLINVTFISINLSAWSDFIVQHCFMCRVNTRFKIKKNIYFALKCILDKRSIYLIVK